MEQERVYSPNQAAIGAFIGGPLVSVMFIKRNFKALGNSSGESKTLLYGIVIILILLGMLPFLPKSLPNMLIPFTTILVTRTIVEKYQIKKQDVTDSGSLTFQSNWRVFWVSLACMMVSLVVIGGVLFGLDALGIAPIDTRRPPSVTTKSGDAEVARQSAELTTVTTRPSESTEIARRSSELAKLRAEFDQEREKARPVGKPYPLFTTGEDGEFAWYVNECLDKIVAKSTEYSHAQEHVTPGSKIIFSVAILPDGRVKAVAVLSNDGGPNLDRLLRRAIQRATPFPRFPQAMAEKHDKLVITRTITYEAGRSRARRESVSEE